MDGVAGANDKDGGNDEIEAWVRCMCDVNG